TSSGVLESDTQIVAFPERQNIILNTAIAVDITVPGTSPSATTRNFSSGTIPIGTKISSYFVHFDDIGDPATPVAASGSITFDTDILGLIVTAKNLDASDSYPGLPSVIYDTGDGGRDLEINPGDVGQGTNDQIILSDDRRTVTLNLRDGTAPDEVRILTTPVPEPASISLLAISGLGLLAYLVRNRRPHPPISAS